jgi:hypothetical protein
MGDSSGTLKPEPQHPTSKLLGHFPKMLPCIPANVWFMAISPFSGGVSYSLGGDWW